VPDDPSDSDSAFDGDADIAYGLMLANRQWGSSGNYNYAALASTRLAGIMASTIGPQSRVPMLGDWVSPKGSKYNQDTPRTSDFMPSHFRAWARFTGNTTWNTVAANSAAVVTAIQANYSPVTSLLPDFSKDARTAPKPVSGTFLEGTTDGYYYYNAGRDPWRLALDALLNNDATSLAQAKKMAVWARTKTAGKPSALRAGYKLDGTNISGNNYFTTFFAAPLAVAAMLDPTHPEWLNALYDSVRTTHEDYYEDSVTLQCLITISGNFWDPTK
jgi:endo-1,4-beta-D-glucanase Y